VEDVEEWFTQAGERETELRAVDALVVSAAPRLARS